MTGGTASWREPRPGASRSVLRISPAGLEAIASHARAAHPAECCGILVGEVTPGGPRVTRVVATANDRRDRAADRYAIPPADLLAIHQQARAAGQEVVGYYHSHPGGDPRPSRVDREHAWSRTSYLIVATDAAGTAGAGTAVRWVRSWRREGEGDDLAEEAVEVVADPASGGARGSMVPPAPGRRGRSR